MLFSDTENSTKTKPDVASLPQSIWHTPRQQINSNVALIDQWIKYSIGFLECFFLRENFDQESKVCF